MPPASPLDIPLRERTVGRQLAAKAALHGERNFLRFEDRQFSYAQAERLSNRLANGLRALGVSAGDHVALLLDNRPEILWLYFALGKLGAVAVPLNTAAKGELLAYYLSQSASSTVLVEAAHVPRLREVIGMAPSVRRIVTLDDDRAAPAARPADDGRWGSLAHAAYCDLEAAGDAPPSEAVAVGDPFLLLYTSGTTGPSKAVVVPHGFAITCGLQRARHFGLGAEDVLYTCLPLFHGNALHGACFTALAADATLVVARRFSARSFWREVRDCGATQFNLLGAMANILWNQPPGDADRAHRARQCTMVPIPAFGREFEQRFGLKLTSVYALSDYGLGTILGPDHPPDKYRSAGIAPEEVELAILDDQDFPLAPGQSGEICLRPTQPWITALGYFGMPDKSLAAVRNLWFHTGDQGYLDADGYLYFVDRKKDAIRRRGENISSWEVEQIAAQHPAVQEVAVFPVQAELQEDEVAAAVVLKAGAALSEAELIAFCDSRMAYFMVPRYLQFCAALPKTATQKVEKFVLRRQAQAELHRLWDREKAGIVLRR